MEALSRPWGLGVVGSVEALGQTGTLGLWDSDDSDRMGIEIRSYTI